MQPMTYQYFDVPQIFENSNLGISFVAALCTQEEVDIFANPSI